MSPRHYVLITGTGRAGTTFLVELFTHLGLETGFSTHDIANKKHSIARAGLEHDITSTACPFIVKSPHFCDYANDALRQKDIVIDHAFIPVRDLHAAAESRRYTSKISAKELSIAQRLKYIVKPFSFPGGLWHTKQPAKQEEMLLN